MSFKVHQDDFLSPEELKHYHGEYKVLAKAVFEALATTIHFRKLVEERVGETRQPHHATFLFFLFEFIDLIDGVGLLVEQGSASNCSPLLRSALEIYLGMKYLVESEETYQQRAISYEYFHFLDKGNWLEKGDPKSDKHKRLAVELKDDILPDALDASKYGIDFVKERDKIKAVLAKPRFDDVRAEYDRMKATRNDKRGPDNWYSLWGGPFKLRDLAKRVNCLSLYEVFYRGWSAQAHGETVFSRYYSSNEGASLVRTIRSPSGLDEQARHATNLIGFVNLLLVNKYLPEKRTALQNIMRAAKPHIDRMNRTEFR